MLESHYKYVLLGGGLASASAAEAIRQRDPAGSILLIGQEVNRPYHRPRLSMEYLKRQRGRSDVVAQSPTWFGDQHISLSTGRRATHLDTARKSVALNTGEEISFDKLLIATGASPRQLTIPGANLPNVFTLRTLDDADRLHNAVEKAKAEGLRHEKGRGVAAIVGGGLLGIELTTTLTQLGICVELILGAPHPWRKYVGEYAGKVIANHLIEHGVRVHPVARPEQIIGDGRVQRVVLSDGTTVPCDFLVAAIGIQPNKELLRSTPITSEKAILASANCETNVPGIFAAGDCAAIFDPLFGKHRLIDHWDNARFTGAIAGTNMAGDPVVYDIVNHFRCNAFDLQLLGWGEPRLVDRRHIRASSAAEQADFIEIGVAADGRVAQALAIGHPGENEVLEALVKQRAQVNGNEEPLKDPAQPLSQFLK